MWNDKKDKQENCSRNLRVSSTTSFELPSVLLSVNTGVLEYDLRRDTNLSVNTFGFSMVEWVENNWYSACKLLFDAQWHLELSKGKN